MPVLPASSVVAYENTVLCSSGNRRCTSVTGPPTEPSGDLACGSPPQPGRASSTKQSPRSRMLITEAPNFFCCLGEGPKPEGGAPLNRFSGAGALLPEKGNVRLATARALVVVGEVGQE